LYIQSLKLKNFRNYENLNISFSKNFNIIYGDNAQGKTNILEAIFLCSSGRSHRTSKDIELLNINKSEYYIDVAFLKEASDSNIEIFFKRDEKKKIRINQIPIKKIGNLMGNLNTVIFSPEDLLIIKEGPSERRRFIDITISQIKPTYFYDLQQYMKILYQRNSLLKEIQKKKSLIDTLDIWNKNLVTTGARIIKVREEFIKRLDKIVEVSHSKLTNGKEKLHLKYSPFIKIENDYTISDIENVFMKTLEQSRSKELFKATTLTGPQRDDYEIYLNDINLKQFGSQGQQRTAILAIKLSEVALMKQETEEYPVILLDDVMSELDKNRQKQLIDNLREIQTFITSTDIDFINYIENSDKKIIKIKNGSIIEANNIT
jgi:DNA replication and repair protein RecF